MRDGRHAPVRPDVPDGGAELRVAFDATPLIGSPTGVGWFASQLLIAAVAHADVEPIAFAMTWRGRSCLRSATPSGVSVVERPMPARLMRALWGLVDFPKIEPWTGRVDVVHGTNFVVPPSRALRVVTVHDMTAWRFPELVERATLAIPHLVQRAASHGAWIHTPSNFVAEEVKTLVDVDPERVVAVASGVPVLAPSAPGAGRRRAGLGDGDRYILALGTIEPRKNHAGLVRAFDIAAKARPDLHLVVAGPAGWGSDAFHRAVEKARTGDRIHVLGYVSDADRAALVRDADVFAYPSVYEGFGFPPLEAMSAGVPVVATSVGSLPEVLSDAALLVPSTDDPVPFADAMTLVLDDDAVRTRLSRSGPAHTSKFSWDTTLMGLVALYRRALGT